MKDKIVSLTISKDKAIEFLLRKEYHRCNSPLPFDEWIVQNELYSLLSTKKQTLTHMWIF